MSDYRPIDCEKWAKDKIKDNKNGKLVHITPKSGKVLSGVVVPGHGMVYPSPPWHYHYAVQLENKWFDAHYTKGISITEFKDRFEYKDNIQFSVSN